MHRPFRHLALLAIAGLALPAAAQFAKPEDAIKYRKSGMFLQATHFGRINAMATGKVPWDAKAVADNAAVLEVVSRLPYAGFVEGTDKGETKAKPEIWTERDKFNAGATKAQDEIVKLIAAARTGNQDQVKTAAGAVGQACKGCHDNYRRE